MSKGSHEVTESATARLCEWHGLNCVVNLDKYRQSQEWGGLIFIYDLYDWQRRIPFALPISTYNGFYAKSDREYTKGMRKNRYFDEIVRSGISDFHGSFREESRENRR